VVKISINELKFRTNSKLEKLIGRELITNNTFDNMDEYEITTRGRIREFFIDGNKVSSDTVVSRGTTKITILDNGDGMSYEDVDKYWMEIGVVHKEKIKKINVETTSIEGMYSRILNGEKGIGRFGTDKLGATLDLVAIDKSGKEKTTITFDWNKFDDHSKLLQDVTHEVNREILPNKSPSGVKLTISNLRDDWSIRDIEELKRQLKKFISPFSQEQEYFSISVKLNEKKEKVINDAFEYSNIFIEGTIDEYGDFSYLIMDNELVQKKEVIKLNEPIYGPVKFKIIYMDRAAKVGFTKRTGLSTRDYGNIKVFRDNFRIFPYGERENDWLGIDNAHAQAVFRSLGTRDIIGYVQISNSENERLKDSTNRIGLVEDTIEFREFKRFVWNSILVLQNYIFTKLKEDTQKEGNIIKLKAEEGKFKADKFNKEIQEVIKKSSLPKEEAKSILNLIEKNNKTLQKDYDEVKKANEELNKKIKVFQRISGSEGILLDLLHSIKNKTAILDAQLLRIIKQANKYSIKIDYEKFQHTFYSINKLVNSALRKASSSRMQKKPEILTDIIEESIEEYKEKLENENINLAYEFKDNYKRVRCNKESVKVVLDNLFSNSIKALDGFSEKSINISTKININFIELYFSDDGPGINDEDAPFIFNVGFTNTKGNGLGLANSLDILQSHDGDISLVSLPDKEEGATFLIKFPIEGN
jgi:signal transduction histidine kinase